MISEKMRGNISDIRLKLMSLMIASVREPDSSALSALARDDRPATATAAELELG